jgi:transcriptional regulator with XRE-family HTH domain
MKRFEKRSPDLKGSVPMPRSFNELRKEMSPAARKRVDKRIRKTLLGMSLQELRQRVTGITQTELAEFMEVTQGAISQLEGRQDVLMSRLAAYVHALGGELQLVARFPDADIRITQFDEEDETPAAANK